MFEASCVAELNEELKSVDSIDAAIIASTRQSSELRDTYMQDCRRATGEMAVLRAKLPSVIAGLKDIKGVLDEFINVSEEVCEAQTFKTRLEEIENQMSSLKLVESCLLVAQDFDANLQSLESLLRNVRSTRTSANLLSELQAQESLLRWWAECENNAEIVETFGQWRFTKFSKIEKELRRHVLEVITRELNDALCAELSGDGTCKITTEQSTSLMALFELCEQCTVLCANFAETLLSILVDWYQMNAVDMTQLDQVGSALDLISETHAINFFNELISINVKQHKHDLAAIQAVLEFRLHRPMKTRSIYTTNAVITEWTGDSSSNPAKITLGQAYIEELYQYHVYQILLAYPVTVKSTMQALSQYQEIKTVLAEIKRRVVDAHPDVTRRLQQLFALVPPPPIQIVAAVITDDFIPAIIQNVYHPLATSFTDAKLTVAPFLALINFIDATALQPVCTLLNEEFAARGHGEELITANLGKVRSLILTNTVEEVRRAYNALIDGYIAQLNDASPNASPPDVQKIASFTLELLRLFFADSTELVPEVETVLLPNTLVSLLEAFLDSVSQANIAESANRCHVVGSDVISLLKLVNSLIVPDDAEKVGPIDPASSGRLKRAQGDLRSIAHACADALGPDDPRAGALMQGLDQLPHE